jgi:hypothetical protein
MAAGVGALSFAGLHVGASAPWRLQAHAAFVCLGFCGMRVLFSQALAPEQHCLVQVSA